MNGHPTGGRQRVAASRQRGSGRDRIRFKNKEIALEELGQPRLENGQLKLRVPGKMRSWASVSVGAVPNLDTFLRLIGNDATGAL